MLNPRLLIVLTDIPDADTLLDMLLSALAHAKRPYNLHFAVPITFAPLIDATTLPPGILRHGDVKYFDETLGLQGVVGLLSDETHFLSLRGVYAFADDWEHILFSRLAKIPAHHTLLTAAITGEEDQAQACLPAINRAGISGAQITAGLPLVCSVAPVKTLLVHPSFLMGRVASLSHGDYTFDTLSIAAYAAGNAVYALDRAPLWPAGRARRSVRLLCPSAQLIPPPSLARYEQLAGFSFAQGTVSVRTSQGVFGVTDHYPQRLPFRLLLRDFVHKALQSYHAPLKPLIVTAFVDLPDALHEPQSYLLRFSFLLSLHHVSMALFTGGEWERYLRSRYPNTLAYPDHTLLPRSMLGEGMTPMQLFKRNKLLLLQRAQRSYPSFSHFAWLDIDVLPHPICTQAHLHYEKLMDNRIHLGWVDGQPDTGMMVIPQRYLTLLIREVQAISQLDSAMKRSFGEDQLIRRLMDKFPDLFTLHPLPRKGLLFLTCLDPSLLSAPLRQQVADLSAPIQVPPGTTTQKGSPTDD